MTQNFKLDRITNQKLKRLFYMEMTIMTRTPISRKRRKLKL